MLRLVFALGSRFIRVVYLMRHPAVPIWLKLVMLLALLYAVWPFDLLRDFIPVVGWVDDWTVLLLATFLFTTLARRYVTDGPSQRREPDGPTIETTYRVLDSRDEGQGAPSDSPGTSSKPDPDSPSTDAPDDNR